MKIINKPTVQIQQTITDKESVTAQEGTWFKATIPEGYVRTFSFFVAAMDRVVLLRIGSLNRWNDSLYFSFGENVRSKLEALGWTNIELIKDKKLKMELV